MPYLLRSKTKAPERSRSRNNRVVEELNPSSGWTEDLCSHKLLIDLHNFNREEIKLQTEGSNQVTISGERKAGDNKFIYFDKTFNVPENSDIERTSWKLEQGLVTVTIPKRPVQLPERKADPESEKACICDNADEKEPNANLPRAETEELKEEESGEAEKEKESDIKSRNLFCQGIAALSENKATILTAFMAFMLGLFASRKLASD